MGRTNDSLKAALVKLGYGTSSDYTSNSEIDTLRTFAVKASCATVESLVTGNTIDEVLDFVTANYPG